MRGNVERFEREAVETGNAVALSIARRAVFRPASFRIVSDRRARFRFLLGDASFPIFARWAFTAYFATLTEYLVVRVAFRNTYEDESSVPNCLSLSQSLFFDYIYLMEISDMFIRLV